VPTTAPKHEYQWHVAWNDDDICKCGAWRSWPGDVVIEVADMTEEQARVAQANADLI